MINKIANLSPKSKKILIVILLVLIAITLKYTVFKKEFLYAGTIDATKVELASQLPSVISEIHAQEGDHINIGEPLVTLACDDYKADSVIANTEYDRHLRMYQKSAVSAELFEVVRKRKQDADIHLQWCSIQSPIQGTVLGRYHEPGEYASPGLKLLTLANIKDAWAYIYVPQTEIAKLKVGMQLNAYLPELNNQKFIGTIIKINSEAEFTPKNVQTREERARLVYGVKVSFRGANDQEILKPGMTVEIKLPDK